MLTSISNAFSSPVARTATSSSPSSTAAGVQQQPPQDLCYHPEPPELWKKLGAALKQHQDLYWWTNAEDCQHPAAKDCHPPPPAAKKSAAVAMEKRIEPEDDLRILAGNAHLLSACGYYYGNLNWMDASHLLKQSKVGTFLVRDSEHHSYLYALSVQTRRGPTSCRIEYLNGRFRLDSSEDLTDKMPRFDSVTDLVDHYVHLTKNLPRKNNCGKELSPVWLDMDEENSMDVPVQIYRPLYKNVRSLLHTCRVAMVRLQKEKYPSLPFSRTIDEKECRELPTVLKNYLKEYPYSQ